jgi:hypothetical protein
VHRDIANCLYAHTNSVHNTLQFTCLNGTGVCGIFATELDVIWKVVTNVLLLQSLHSDTICLTFHIRTLLVKTPQSPVVTDNDFTSFG